MTDVDDPLDPLDASGPMWRDRGCTLTSLETSSDHGKRGPVAKVPRRRVSLGPDPALSAPVASSTLCAGTMTTAPLKSWARVARRSYASTIPFFSASGCWSAEVISPIAGPAGVKRSTIVRRLSRSQQIDRPIFSVQSQQGPQYHCRDTSGTVSHDGVCDAPMMTWTLLTFCCERASCTVTV